jgi:hypothetical protein
VYCKKVCRLFNKNDHYFYQQDKRSKDVWVPGALPSTTVELKTPLKRTKSNLVLHPPHSLCRDSVLPKHLVTTHPEYSLMEVRRCGDCY